MTTNKEIRNMEKIKFKYTEDVAVNGAAVGAEESYFDGYKDDYYNILSVWLRMAQTMSGVYKFSESLCDNGKEIMLSYSLDGVVITKKLFMYFRNDGLREKSSFLGFSAAPESNIAENI